jgi:hypothetical protein
MDPLVSQASEEAIAEEADRPFGPVAAAFLAAGIGSLVLGLLTTLAEASATLKEKLQFSDPVGPLSGKTIISVAAWAVAWVVLHLVLRRQDPAPRTTFLVTAVLVALGLLGTFPTFFERFAAE